MAASFRVKDLTAGRELKRSQADRLVELCVYAWVEQGVSIRKLSLAEMVAARSEKARLDEPLPLSELRHLRYEAPESKKNAAFMNGRYQVLRESRQFCFASALHSHITTAHQGALSADCKDCIKLGLKVLQATPVRQAREFAEASA